MTFNVRTLNRIGQVVEVTASAMDHDIDADANTDTLIAKISNITLFSAFSWKKSVSATIGSVGMLIGPQALKLFNSIEKIQSKLMVATFNGNYHLLLIQIFSLQLWVNSRADWVLQPW